MNGLRLASLAEHLIAACDAAVATSGDTLSPEESTLVVRTNEFAFRLMGSAVYEYRGSVVISLARDARTLWDAWTARTDVVRSRGARHLVATLHGILTAMHRMSIEAQQRLTLPPSGVDPSAAQHDVNVAQTKKRRRRTSAIPASRIPDRAFSLQQALSYPDDENNDDIFNALMREVETTSKTTDGDDDVRAVAALPSHGGSSIDLTSSTQSFVDSSSNKASSSSSANVTLGSAGRKIRGDDDDDDDDDEGDEGRSKPHDERADKKKKRSKAHRAQHGGMSSHSEAASGDENETGEMGLDPTVCSSTAEAMMQVARGVPLTEITQLESLALKKFRRLAILLAGAHVNPEAREQREVAAEIAEFASHLAAQPHSRVCAYLANHLFHALPALSSSSHDGRRTSVSSTTSTSSALWTMPLGLNLGPPSHS